MARGVLENLFQCRKDRCVVCTHRRSAVYAGVAVFGSVVDLMDRLSLVSSPACMPPIKRRRPQLGISAKPWYDKWRQVELRVSAELVRGCGPGKPPRCLVRCRRRCPLWCPGTGAKILDGIISPPVPIALKHCVSVGGSLWPGQILSCWISADAGHRGRLV